MQTRERTLCCTQRLIMQILAWFLLLAAACTATTTDASITFPQTSDTERSGAQPMREVEHPGGYIKQMANHVASLGLHTLRDLLSGNSNVIISPLNVYSCLGILRAGAAGDTKEEIRRVVGDADGNHSIREIIRSNSGVSYASAVFLDHRFTPRKEFVDGSMAEFQASVLNMNVSNGEQAKDMINGWVSDHTNGTIENLLQRPLDPNTRMVVASALLFQGKWLHAFPTATTLPGKFKLGESFVEVPFMHHLATVPLVRNPTFDAISLPYIDTHGMTMHVILPKVHGVNAIKDLLSHLTPTALRKLRKESISEEIFIMLPKMAIGGRFSLTDSLKKQGIVAMFNPSKANFTDLMHDSQGLFVSEIYHSIHFEMNEEGTVASAASAAVLTKSKKFVFGANRPFMFVITDESDFILFMGVIVNPVP